MSVHVCVVCGIHRGSHFEIKKRLSGIRESHINTTHNLCKRARFQCKPIYQKQNKSSAFLSFIRNSREISIKIGLFSRIHTNWHYFGSIICFLRREKNWSKINVCAVTAAAAVYPCISKNLLHEHSTHTLWLVRSEISESVGEWVSECVHACVGVYVW